MDNSQQDPIIVGFVADLMFTTRIDNVARHLGFQVQWIPAEAAFGPAPEVVRPERPGEVLHGPIGRLIGHLVRLQPALLLFDLSNEQIPWRKWIGALKNGPATRHMPILCFGPHTDVNSFNEAKSLGADAVLARSRFTTDMPNLLRKHASIPDRQVLVEACQGSLSDLARQGIKLHNQGEYFEAHELLEDAWHEEKGAGRNLYRGMVQVTVTYLQVERGNYRGAVKMCLRLRQWLAPLPDVCMGVDVDHMRRSIQAIQDELERLGPDNIDELDRGRITAFPVRRPRGIVGAKSSSC